MVQPEQQAREEIDRLLAAAGWQVCGLAQANIHAARGVALREFPLEAGFGFADYLLSIAREAETEAEVEANLKRVQALRQAILARAFQPSAVRPVPTFAFLEMRIRTEDH